MSTLIDLILNAYRNETLDCDHKTAENRIKAALPFLIKRAKNTVDLTDLSEFLLKQHDYPLTEIKAKQLIATGLSEIREIQQVLSEMEDWSEDTLNTTLRTLADNLQLGFGKLAQPLRVALTGSTKSPGIFDVMTILGRTETLRRLERVPHDETH